MSAKKLTRHIEAIEQKLAVPTFETYKLHHPDTTKSPTDPFFSPGHGHKKKPKPQTTHQFPGGADPSHPGQQDHKNFSQHDHAFMSNAKTQAGADGVAGILKHLHQSMASGQSKYVKELAKKHGAQNLLQLAHKIHTHSLN